MAENDTMEGKDLAIKEKKEFEERVLEAIENLKEGQTTTSTEGLEVTNNKGNYIIKLKGIPFGLISKDGKFTYNKENFKQVKNTLGEEGITLEDLGLPDIEEWIDKEEKQKEENQKDEKDLSDDIEEKEDEEPEKDEKTEDEAKKEIAKKHNVSPNQVVHVSMDRRITDNDNFQGLAKWSKKYNDIYVIPGKDEYSWETIGIDKDGKEEVINNRQQEGKNQNVKVKIVDGKEITEVRPIAMYEIDDKQSYAIVRDNAGKTKMLYCRQEEGRGKEYWGIGVPEQDTKNVREKSVEGRDFIDSRNNSSYDLSKKADELEKGTDLEERGIPSKEGKGVQVEEIEGTPAQNRLLRKDDIVDDLLKRDGIIDRAKAMPGFYENKAEKVLKLMETNDKISYEEAVESVEKSDREPGGRTPDEKPNKREH